MANSETPVFLLYGGAKKSVFDMTVQELEQAGHSIRRRAKEKAFSKGLPIYFSRNQKLMAEYPDGRIEEVKEIK